MEYEYNELFTPNYKPCADLADLTVMILRLLSCPGHLLLPARPHQPSRRSVGGGGVGVKLISYMYLKLRRWRRGEGCLEV